MKPFNRRFRIQRIDSPQIERNSTRTRELFIIRVGVLRCIQIHHVSCSPSIRTNYLVFCDPTSSHLTSFTHSRRNNARTSQLLSVIVQPFTSCRLNVFRQTQINLTLLRTFTTWFHLLSNRHSNHLVNRILLRLMATNDFAIFLLYTPTSALRVLVRNKVWHQIGSVNQDMICPALFDTA